MLDQTLRGIDQWDDSLVMDITKPISDLLPCGEDLEYDAEFLALQSAAVGVPEQQFGSAIIPPQQPDWAAVEQHGYDLLRRTKDLRVAALITRAWTERDGLPGFARGLWMVAEWLDRYWSTLHPRLDVLDEHDPLPRISAMEAFGDPQGMLQSVRGAVVLRRRLGDISLRELVLALEELRRGEGHSPKYGEYSSLLDELREAFATHKEEVVAIPKILELVGAIKQRFAQELGAASVPKLAMLATTLRGLVSALEHDRGAGPHGANEDSSGRVADASAESMGTLAGTGASARSLLIKDRQDVVTVLEKTCAYLLLHEPSHPSPLLIRRAIRLLQMNFLELVNDLAPAGLGQVELLAGRSSVSGEIEGAHGLRENTQARI